MEIERDYGKSTPVIFTGHYSTPYSLVEDYYVSYGSWQYSVIAAITDKVDPHLKENISHPRDIVLRERLIILLFSGHLMHLTERTVR